MDKKKFNFKSILVGLISFLIGCFGGGAIVFFITAIMPENAAPWYPFVAFAILIVMGYLQIVIHEAGHLVFGLLSGYKFCSFRIMSFTITKIEGKLRIKKFKLAGTGGQCLMIPPELNEGNYPVKLYNFGGALLNLITAVIGFVLCIFIDNEFVTLGGVFFACFGFFFALSNGIPIKTSLISNDGYNAISLSKDKKAARALWIQLMINAKQTEGVRIKDMPEEWFEMPDDEDMKNNLISAIGVLHCDRLTDMQELEKAEKEMERLLALDSGIAGIHRSLMTCGLIYLKLMLDRDFESVEKLFTKEQETFMKSMKNFPSVILTRYTYALLGERIPENAEKYQKLFEKVAKTYPLASDIESTRELMILAKNKAESEAK